MHKRHLIKLVGLTVLAAISVMAVSATAAQASLLTAGVYTLLLNGKSVEKLELGIKNLGGELIAENGLKIKCTGGEGTATAEKKEGGKKVTGEAKGTFTGCVWVGSEKTCTINDGGVGHINAEGTGEVVMPGTNEYVVTASSPEFSSVVTEGVFCTIPEEEPVSGSAHVLIENASADTKEKTGKILALSLKLGNSKVTSLTGNVDVYDLKDPTATIAIH